MSEFMYESWWKLESPKINTLVGPEYPLPTPRRPARRSLWALNERTGPEELQAAAQCAGYWARELDQGIPLGRGARINWDEQHVWIWTIPGRDTLFTVTGACAFERDARICH